MITSMVRVIDQSSVERGMNAHPRDPCKEIFKLYKAKSIFLDPTINLIKQNVKMHKTSRQRMAPTSIFSLVSHTVVVAYSVFMSRSNKWSEYKQIIQSANEFLNIIRKFTGTTSEPINPTFLLNEDRSSQY